MDLYIQLSTGNYPINVEAIKDDLIAMLDYALVEVATVPEYDATKYQLVVQQPEIVDGQWKQFWSVVLKPIEEQSYRVRAQRNEKLSACDWTQVADAPVDKTVWANYRQELRNVPAQAGFPWDITWPTQP